MLDVFAVISVILALVPAMLTVRNLMLYRPPPQPSTEARPEVSILIPARNEADNIEACVTSALASKYVTPEVIVLDDGSTDRTVEIVERLAAKDPRVRVESAPPLPSGWSGKQHACHVLSKLATAPLLIFVDADVRLTDLAASRMAAMLADGEIGLASGFPREETKTLAEKLVIPIIHFLLIGYLPFDAMRNSNKPAFGAGCGQLFVARRQSYDAAGGHTAIHDSLHDGIKLPRAFRRAGIKTDLFDATGLASCRMYRGAAEVWSGFTKNATEGMATPIALPIWTILLFGGHVLPFILLPYAVYTEANAALGFTAAAAAIGTRLILAWQFKQSWIGALLHPVGVLIVLFIQWLALLRSRIGDPVTWRGRSY